MNTRIDEKRVEEERMKQQEEGTPSGGWFPIKDIKDPDIDVIAKFAISEFNKQNNSALKFKTVVSGNMQVVCGINFRLVIEVSDADHKGSKTYEAQVYDEQAWLYSKELTYFKSID